MSKCTDSVHGLQSELNVLKLKDKNGSTSTNMNSNGGKPGKMGGGGKGAL